MEMINIDDAKEGMIIIREILNDQGDTLLKEGTALTKDLIRKLKSLGISGVCVENPEKNNSSDAMPSEVSTELQQIEYRFSNVRSEAIMEELMAAVKEYITEKDRSDGIH